MGPTLVNMTQGKNACRVAPDSLVKGQAINPLTRINAMEAPVNDSAEIGSKVLADSDIKIKTGSAKSTTSLLAPPRSGLTRRL